MKKSGIILLTLITFLLGACATTTSTSQVASSHTELTKAEKYRALVHAEADRKNVELTWVNPPDEDDLEKYDEL